MIPPSTSFHNIRGYVLPNYTVLNLVASSWRMGQYLNVCTAVDLDIYLSYSCRLERYTYGTWGTIYSTSVLQYLYL